MHHHQTSQGHLPSVWQNKQKAFKLIVLNHKYTNVQDTVTSREEHECAVLSNRFIYI